MKRILPIALMLALVISGIGIPLLASAQREQLPPWRIPMPPARSTTEIVVGDTPLTVDLALTSEEQHLGLGYRNGLEPETGMLFVFPESVDRTFSMRGMRICLDIIWIANGEIVGAAESVCPDPEGAELPVLGVYPSPQSVSHVLEMSAGWLVENGYGAGTPVRIPDPLG